MWLEAGDIRVGRGKMVRGYVGFDAGVGSIVRIPVVLVNGKRDGPVIGITGGVHGAEFSSVEAAIRLSNELNPNHLKGGLIIFPIVNVPAFEGIRERYNPLEWPALFASASSLPGDPKGTHTARIVSMVYECFKAQCKYVLDLHGGEPSEWINYHAVLFPQTGNHKVDAMTRVMARCFPNARLVVTKDPESDYTGNEYEKIGIPNVVAEAGSAGFFQEEAVQYHLAGVRNFMRYLGMIQGKANLAPEPKKLPTFRNDIHNITSLHGGIYYPSVRPGQKVPKGKQLALIKNAFGEVLQDVRANMRCVVMYTRTYPPVRPGDFLMQVLSLERTLKGLE
jgi:predicted deacylase